MAFMGIGKKDKDGELLAKLDNWWKHAEKGRADLDWRWFIYDLWVSGNHYAKYDKASQQITTTQRDVGKPKVVINKIYTTLRAVRNFTLRNRPRVEVVPSDYSANGGVDVSNKLNKYTDYLHERLHLRRKLKESLWHALKYSVGFWQILWDEDAAEITANVIDPNDLYLDSVARSPEELRYAILAVRRDVDSVIHDEKYREHIKKNKIELRGDGKLAASSLKERTMTIDKPGVQTKDDKEATIIVKEYWYKEWSEEDNAYVIMLCTKAGEHVIRPPEKTDLTRLPFFRLPSDIAPLSMYGEGWVKNLISPNKLLDRLESQVAEYNDLMNRGKWITDKGAGVRVINNENGQIIEKKRGFDVTPAPIVSLSSAIFKQIENANTYIEDIGGAHDASLGRIPTGAKSGKALEALQVGDSNNMSEIIENVEEFLEEVFEYIISLAAKKYQFIHQINPISTTGEKDVIRLIGEDSAVAEEGVPEGTVVIPKNVVVDVKISSWLAQTQEARRDALKELFQAQAIPVETLLTGYEIGNVADVIAKLRKEQEVARAQDMTQQLMLADAQNQGNKGPQEEAPAPAGPVNANAALQAVILGQEPQIPEPVSPEFVSYVDQFINSPDFKSLPPEDQEKVMAFRAQLGQSIR